MAYRVVLDLTECTGRILDNNLAYSFNIEKVNLNCSEAFIPDRGDSVLFKHEGRWWNASVREKCVAFIPNVSYSKGFDYLVTLRLDTCWEQRSAPSL